MMYGVSGSTKTSQAYHLAQWIFKTTGKKLRMIHSDGGGYAPFQDSGMIDRGEVEVFDYTNRQYALSDWRWLSQGYWPRKDKGGNEVFLKTNQFKTTPEEFNEIGGYIIEGLASSGEVLKTHCSNQREGVGFKESWSYEEQGETITGLQMGHYDLIQKELYSTHMKGFNCLPIPWLIYTSLLGKGNDKNSKETVYGPQVVGNAMTPAVPAWFMDCLHLNTEKYVSTAKDGTQTQVEGVVAWFQRHEDTSTGVPCLAKARVMPELYPKLLEYFPHGFVPLGFKSGIVNYFKVMEILKKQQGEIG